MSVPVNAPNAPVIALMHVPVDATEYDPVNARVKAPVNVALARTPVMDGLRALIQQRGDEEDVDALAQHIIFAAMLVQLSAITTRNMVSDRKLTHFTADERSAYNPFAANVRTLLASMRGQNLDLLKWVLRDDEVRGVLAHYMGRRNSGTRRVLAMAQGVERP